MQVLLLYHHLFSVAELVGRYFAVIVENVKSLCFYYEIIPHKEGTFFGGGLS